MNQKGGDCFGAIRRRSIVDTKGLVESKNWSSRIPWMANGTGSSVGARALFEWRFSCIWQKCFFLVSRIKDLIGEFDSTGLLFACTCKNRE
jgi:hypothetical protein